MTIVRGSRDVDAYVLIAGIYMLGIGVGGTYYAIALIGNLHGFADKRLKSYADYRAVADGSASRATIPPMSPSPGARP